MSQPLSIVMAFVVALVPISLARGETLVLKKQTFVDPGSGHRPSHALLVPDGWSVEGGAFWPNPAIFRNPPSRQVKVTSPDGFGYFVSPVLTAVDFQPNAQGESHGYHRKRELEIDMGALVLYRPESLQQWREFFDQKVAVHAEPSVSQLRVQQVFQIPELKSVVEKLMQPTQQHLNQTKATYAQMGIRQWIECDAVGIRTEFRQNGRPVESLQVLVVTSVVTAGPYGRSDHWTIALDVSFYGPKGKLEPRLPLLVSLATSVREVPAWTRMKLDHMAKIDGIMRQGFMERSRILAETTQEIMQMRHDSYRRRAAASDRMHQRFIDSIHEVERYSQAGSQYELPAGYGFVYGDGQGNFILTDDSLFQPNVDLDSTANWSRVSPQR